MYILLMGKDLRSNCFDKYWVGQKWPWLQPCSQGHVLLGYSFPKQMPLLWVLKEPLYKKIHFPHLSCFLNVTCGRVNPTCLNPRCLRVCWLWFCTELVCVCDWSHCLLALRYASDHTIFSSTTFHVCVHFQFPPSLLFFFFFLTVMNDIFFLFMIFVSFLKTLPV